MVKEKLPQNNRRLPSFQMDCYLNQLILKLICRLVGGIKKACVLSTNSSVNV